MAMVEAAVPASGSQPDPNAPTALSVGVVLWLSSELMFFSGLFAAYFTLRSISTGPWPPPHHEIGLVRPAIFTAILVVSSFTMHHAVREAHNGRRTASLRWLAVTFTLGAVFVANQAIEYTTLPFSISTDAYGSVFYLMTGFHGLHVVGGLLLMIVVAGVVGGDTSKAPLAAIVDATAYYWHFVDVVWVAMFSTIYLLR